MGLGGILVENNHGDPWRSLLFQGPIFPVYGSDTCRSAQMLLGEAWASISTFSQ